MLRLHHSDVPIEAGGLKVSHPCRLLEQQNDEALQEGWHFADLFYHQSTQFIVDNQV